MARTWERPEFHLPKTIREADAFNDDGNTGGDPDRIRTGDLCLDRAVC